MPDKNSHLMIEQIYNFVCMKPSIKSKSKYMQMYIFFEELHESTKDRFIAYKPFTYFGVFNGGEKKIYADAAPEFFDKVKFINWVVKSIN
ncbi:hypothetical protein B9T33_02350 [Acinetobacter sp. ANC 5054]|uniref:hypothetical protein n=1 Tax=Acinetobacter sp. ANC 5054 TaxID=1977877 RepID=UPI000A35BAF1|nr:hypothetical protein [Acinetobacter sp. ANC 5054]OTG83272.1 hypothetical protein B9T33_02350 [Acinetobacter sp. ANC 5054]